jgi:hypothetical protein
MADSQAGIVVGKVSKYCVAGLVLNKEGMYEVAKATELCKRFMKEKVRILVDSCNGMPMRMSYSSDGTPLHTRNRLHIEVVGQQTSRSGEASKEFFVQQCFFRAHDIDGQPQTLVVLREPLALCHGKGHMAVFSAALELHPP